MTAPDTSADQDVASGGTIIQRKAQAGRAEHKARAMSLGKALRLTLARCADDLYDLALAVIGVRFETCDSDDLADKLANAGLLMLLDGPMRARAAAIFDPVLVGALIQQQTMGKVIRQAEHENRPQTPTDAAVCAPFLDSVLARVASMPEDEADKQLVAGFSFGAWVEDRRVLSMALEAHEYRLVYIDLDIAGGVRQGKIMLCLPVAEAELAVAAPSSSPDALAVCPTPSQTLSETVHNLNAVLRISLARIKMPLRRLGTLEVGSVLEIGAPDFDAVRIETIDGQTVSRGALGLVQDVRAVRVQGAKDAVQDQTWSVQKPREGSLEAGADSETDALPELPDITMGPGSEADIEDETLPDLPELDHLPDLPDMSDLPDFDDDATLPQLNAG